MKVMRSITEALDGKGKPVKRHIPFGDSGRNKRRKAQNLKMRELAGANNGSTLWRFGLLNDNQNDNNDNNNICETLTDDEFSIHSLRKNPKKNRPISIVSMKKALLKLEKSEVLISRSKKIEKKILLSRYDHIMYYLRNLAASMNNIN